MAIMRSATTLRAAANIRLLIGISQATENQVIAATGITAINSKKHGKAPITFDDVEKLADFFDLEPFVFLMPEPDLLRHIADRGGLRIPKRSCNAEWWAERPKLFDDSYLFAPPGESRDPYRKAS